MNVKINRINVGKWMALAFMDAENKDSDQIVYNKIKKTIIKNKPKKIMLDLGTSSILSSFLRNDEDFILDPEFYDIDITSKQWSNCLNNKSKEAEWEYNKEHKKFKPKRLGYLKDIPVYQDLFKQGSIMYFYYKE